jgi:NAD(P)-dependent dehydrogenase (short-subunit alcohol dehydrogenase family)
MPAILVTGASRGFGRAVAEVHHGRGWTVFPLVRRPEAALEWGGREGCHPILADVGETAVEPAIATALAAHGARLDVLVNNAGHVRKLRGLAATEPDEVAAAFHVHCLGALRCTRAALPFLRAAPAATVVNVSSRFGSIGRILGGDFRGIYSYCVAKSALNMLTACLDSELRREGIRVWAVHPGRLRTAAAAADADVDPREAAERFADWLATADRGRACGLHDLMEGSDLPW